MAHTSIPTSISPHPFAFPQAPQRCLSSSCHLHLLQTPKGVLEASDSKFSSKPKRKRCNRYYNALLWRWDCIPFGEGTPPKIKQAVDNIRMRVGRIRKVEGWKPEETIFINSFKTKNNNYKQWVSH